jgi:hypothetical protein
MDAVFKFISEHSVSVILGTILISFGLIFLICEMIMGDLGARLERYLLARQSRMGDTTSGGASGIHGAGVESEESRQPEDSGLDQVSD